MPSMTTVKCKTCKKPFEARTADVNRGWGKYCSKSCKAKKQARSAKPSERWYPTNISYEPWDDEVLNGDVKYSHKHRTWIVRDDGSDPFIDSHPFDSDAAGFNNT